VQRGVNNHQQREGQQRPELMQRRCVGHADSVHYSHRKGQQTEKGPYRPDIRQHVPNFLNRGDEGMVFIRGVHDS